MKPKLSKLVLASRHLNAQFLLQKLAWTDLYYEQAILQGRLGAHDKALELLVVKAGEPGLAGEYCDTMAAGDSRRRGELLLRLLKLYLGPTEDRTVRVMFYTCPCQLEA